MAPPVRVSDSHQPRDLAASDPRPQPFFTRGQKARFVRELFDRIAGRYDRLNRITSLGMDRQWRARAIQLTGLQPGDTALDVACGTGDFLPGLRARVGDRGAVFGLDFSQAMLRRAHTRLDGGHTEAVLVRGDAENLPFQSESFQAVTVGFALRNLTDLELAFREMHRVLSSGGKAVALEISRPAWWPYRPVFLFYFEKVLPLIAALFGGERQAYRWLPASLAAFCSREGVVGHMVRAGFVDVKTQVLAAGAVCIFTGEKV